MLAAIILFIILASIVGILYVLNKNTKVPEECKDMKMDCNGCKIISCINHPSKGGN